MPAFHFISSTLLPRSRTLVAFLYQKHAINSFVLPIFYSSISYHYKILLSAFQLFGADLMLSCWFHMRYYMMPQYIHRTHHTYEHTHKGSYEPVQTHTYTHNSWIWYDLIRGKQIWNAKSSALNFKCIETFKCQCRPNPLKSKHNLYSIFNAY